MKKYTNHFDSGYTHLFGGVCISKDSPLVEAYGAVDELNSLLGLSRSFMKDQELKDIIREIQEDLLIIGADLSNPKNISIQGKEHKSALTNQHVKKMEELIQAYEKELPPLTHFVLPSGSPASSLLQNSRALCRKTERRLVSADKDNKINMEILRYFNRLSDFLFYLARVVNKREGFEEEVWK